MPFECEPNWTSMLRKNQRRDFESATQWKFGTEELEILLRPEFRLALRVPHLINLSRQANRTVVPNGDHDNCREHDRDRVMPSQRDQTQREKPANQKRGRRIQEVVKPRVE